MKVKKPTKELYSFRVTTETLNSIKTIATHNKSTPSKVIRYALKTMIDGKI